MTNLEIIKDAEVVIHDPERTCGISGEDIGLIGAALGIARIILRDLEGRSKGCEFCRTKYNKEDWAEYYPHDFRIDGGELYFNDSKLGWEGIKIKFCPMCGRPLKGD